MSSDDDGGGADGADGADGDDVSCVNRQLLSITAAAVLTGEHQYYCCCCFNSARTRM